MKKSLATLFICLIGILMLSQIGLSQQINKKVKTIRPEMRTAKKIDKKQVAEKIKSNTRSYRKNLSGSWLMNEDFETGNFPPSGWTVTSGSEVWQEAPYSGYGTGNYSMFYSNWNCSGSNTIYTTTFPQTSNADFLIFDYAYRPWNDGNNTYYDDLEIFYYSTGDNSWHSLIYINGQDLQTGSETSNYFVPASNEWGTKYIPIPANATQIYFNSIENCSNNIYVDNIKVGAVNNLLFEDFESGIFPPPGWNNPGNGSYLWESSVYSAFGNGDYSAFYNFYDCDGGSDDSLVSPSFNSTSGSEYLSFDYAYAPYDTFDVDDMEIFYSTDQGGNWNSLIYYSGFDLQTAPFEQGPYQPQNNEWQTKSILLPYGTNRISFVAINGCGNNMYVDNIAVSAPVNSGGDASVEFVWAKGKLPLVYGVPDKIPALIKNNSANTITNLKVYLNITGTSNLSDSLVIPSIGAGDTMQVEFLGFTPVLNGFSNVTVSLPDDEDNNNNSKSYVCQSNPNTIRYVDSNCCNSGVGWIGENAFLNKYYMSGTGQIRNVNIKIGANNAGQIVYGYVLDNNGNVLGKSPHYKIKSTDDTKYVSFPITDPKPPIITNNFYYIGIAQTEFAGDGFAFTPQEMLYEAPSRPDANYGSGVGPAGSTVGVFEFPREYGQNYAIEGVIGNQTLVDNGISDLGPVYDQYYNSTTVTLKNKVFNAGTGLSSFNIKRTITPGGYTSTKSVSGLAAGANAFVTFDPWTFTSGTTYTIKDTILTFDGNMANNQMTSTITPRIAKDLCILWAQQQDRDSLVRSVLNDGRYANNFDTVRINYTGSYRPWKILFVNFKEEANYSQWVRDSMKAFIDNSTAGNKKSLIVFGDAIANSNDPSTGYPSPADSVFYRQYLKAKTISDDWIGSIPSSGSKFRGVGFFSGITQDSVSDPYTPELIKPTNGSIAAFKPKSVTGNGADSCNAVCFAGANYNTFFMTNKFSSLRSTSSSPSFPLGPVRVYTKIIDWLQNSNTGAKVLDLTVKLQGFYNQTTNQMVRDTMRVFLRNATSPFAIVDSAKSYLNQAGQGSFVFSLAANSTPYYIQLKHRNGLETWSKTTQVFSSGQLSYNFTTDSAKAFGNNMKKQGSNWVIYTGDVNQNGNIDLTDIVLINNDASVFSVGYRKTDVNGDNFTDLSDLIQTNNNSSGFVQKVTPSSGPEILAKYKVSQDLIRSNEKVNITDKIQSEFIPDNEIYEATKNKFNLNAPVPDIMIRDKNNTFNIIKNLRKNR
ncbi:MAG: hypothetical protein KDD00_10460 [Ignavibacteriae bacterium]|nr:hypothetical protein [Ignavibacteriota bacterium]